MPWIAGALGASEQIYQTSIDALPAPYSEHPTRPYMRRFADRIGDLHPRRRRPRSAVR